MLLKYIYIFFLKVFESVRQLLRSRASVHKYNLMMMAKFWCEHILKGDVLGVDSKRDNLHITRACVTNAENLKEGTRATLLCCLNTNAPTEVRPRSSVLCDLWPPVSILPPTETLISPLAVICTNPC